jgi:hypothetical protein
MTSKEKAQANKATMGEDRRRNKRDCSKRSRKLVCKSERRNLTEKPGCQKNEGPK